MEILEPNPRQEEEQIRKDNEREYQEGLKALPERLGIMEILTAEEMDIDWTDDDGNETDKVTLFRSDLECLLNAQLLKDQEHEVDAVAKAYSKGCDDKADEYTHLIDHAIKKNVASAVNKVIEHIDINELLTALEQAVTDSEATLEATGGCEHDVGICACDEIRNVARMKELIPKLQQLKQQHEVK